MTNIDGKTTSNTTQFIQGYRAFGTGQKMSPYREGSYENREWSAGWMAANADMFEATKVGWQPSLKWKVGFQGVDPKQPRVSVHVYKDMGVWRWHVSVEPYQMASEVLAMGMSAEPEVSKAAVVTFLRSPEYQTALVSFKGVL